MLVYDDAIPIRTLIQLQSVRLHDSYRYVGGHYIRSDDPKILDIGHNGGPSIVINTNRARSSWANSLLHEYWHFIEEHVRGAEGTTPKCKAALRDLAEAITGTNEYKRVLADYDDLKEGAIVLGDALAYGATGAKDAAEVTPQRVEDSKVYLKITAYHVQADEWIARCYVQWVATKSGLDCGASIIKKTVDEKTVTGLPIYLRDSLSIAKVSGRFEYLFKCLDCSWL